MLNIETTGATLPREAVALYEELVPLVSERAEEMGAAFGLDLASVARLCVHASSLRGVPTIAEFAARTLARLLDLDAAQISLVREGGAYQLASFWRRPESSLKPLDEAEVRQSLTSTPSPAPTPPTASSTASSGYPLRVAGGAVGAVIGRTAAAAELSHEQIEAATLFAQHTAA